MMLVSPEISPNALVVHRACHWKSVLIEGKLALVSQPIGKNNEKGRQGNGAFTTMCSLQKISEVQQQLGVSRSSVYRLINHGQLDVIYVLSSPRITQESIDFFIEQNLAAKGVAR